MDFSGNGVFWCHKPKHVHFFIKNDLQRTVEYLIESFYFEVGNLTILQPLIFPCLLTQPLFGLIFISQNINRKKTLLKLKGFMELFELLMIFNSFMTEFPIL